MGSFINNLVSRSTDSVPTIQPRLRGKFERDVASADFLAGSDGSTFNAGEPGESQEVQRPVHQATTAVIPPIENMIDERAENVRQSRLARRLQTNSIQKAHHLTQENPERINRGPLAPQPIHEDTSAERKVENSDYAGSLTNNKTSADEALPDNNKPGQIPKRLHVPSAKEWKTPGSNETYKSLPVVKPATDLAPAAEIPQTPRREQPGVSITQQKTSPVLHSQTINISIGRVEVRVSQPPAPLAAKQKKEGVAVMSLDEFLRKRGG